nr:hypothetical protein [Pseudopedobacter sp.]
MGRIIKGILGGFVGKVGTVIGSQRNGVDMISSLPKKSTKAPTELQLNQRDRFSLGIGFLKPINTVLKLGFKSADPRLSSINVAMSQLLQNAIIGATGNYSLDYTKILISKGELSPGFNSLALSENAAELKVTWSTVTSSGLANPDDESLVVIYNPAKDQHFMSISGVIRSIGEIAISLPSDYSGDEVHCWLGFVAKDKKTRSTSTYAGMVAIV